MENSRPRVLVIDDDADTSRLIRILLNSHGYDCLSLTSATQGMTSLRSFKPHVVLLDIAMPSIDGFTLAKSIREEPGFEEIPLVAISGYAEHQLAEESRQVGFARWLLKPVEFAVLTQAIQATLHQAFAEQTS